MFSNVVIFTPHFTFRFNTTGICVGEFAQTNSAFVPRFILRVDSCNRQYLQWFLLAARHYGNFSHSEILDAD